VSNPITVPTPRRTVRVGGALALALGLTAATAAQAQDYKSYPGSACQASGSVQGLYYNDYAVANRQDATASAACPIVRDNVSDPWTRIIVHVRDRHSTQDICCVARARDLNGGSAWAETVCTSGESVQALSFGPPQSAVPAWGPYTLLCSLPPMEEPNQPSYIASYRIAEP
jgi:hypothetical protein